jgi:HK97 family phage portal protein
LFIADSFCKTERGTKEISFENVVVKGETVHQRLPASKAIHIVLSWENVKALVDSMARQYDKLISCGVGQYKRESGYKGFLQYERIRQGDKEDQERHDKAIQEQFAKFFRAESAVMRFYRGEKYLPLVSPDKVSGTSRDIRAMIDDIMDYTAIAFAIPPSAIRGNVENTQNAIDQLLTFCIDPLTDTIAEEINRKRYSEGEYLSGDYLRIDTTAVKHIDLFDIATAFDKLLGSGGFTIDELRKRCGANELMTDWSRAHFLTKNYSPITESANNLEGG